MVLNQSENDMVDWGCRILMCHVEVEISPRLEEDAASPPPTICNQSLCLWWKQLHSRAPDLRMNGPGVDPQLLQTTF